MFKDFNTRFTHAMLMAIIILLTLKDTSTIGGEIGRMLHGPLVILFCILWALFVPRRPPDDVVSRESKG